MKSEAIFPLLKAGAIDKGPKILMCKAIAVWYIHVCYMMLQFQQDMAAAESAGEERREGADHLSRDLMLVRQLEQHYMPPASMCPTLYNSTESQRSANNTPHPQVLFVVCN